MKLCKDCKHYRFSWFKKLFEFTYLGATCHHPTSEPKIGPVTGKYAGKWPYCFQNRRGFSTITRCGAKARYFEPR